MSKPNKPVERIIFRNDLCDEDYGFTKLDDNDNEVPCTDPDEVAEMLEMYLDDEKSNLDKSVDGCIVAFVDMGLWNGRPKGSKVYTENVNSIFSVMQDYNKFYADRYDIRADLTHHDGTHHVLFRVAKSQSEAVEICAMIAYGNMTEKTFRRRTKSLRPYVAEVYGW